MVEEKQKKCYIVMEGGAVKGAALVGAVARLEELGVEVVGYGGASVGAIIASLYAVGYNSKELKKLILEKNFIDFLDGFKYHVDLRGILREFPFLSFGNSVKIIPYLFKYKIFSVVKRLLKDKGLYDGNEFYLWIKKLIEEKDFKDNHGAVTFGSLKAKEIDLRILATNLTRRKPHVFSYKMTAGEEISHAVRASMAIPLYFKPHKVGGDHFIVDGGLVSNFPAWLFSEESKITKYPIIGLRMKRTFREENVNVFSEYCLSIYNTVFEASNFIQNMPLENMHPIVIDTGKYHSFEFGLSLEAKSELYWAGFDSVDAYLKKHNNIF